jgi:hypothetical protein
MENKVNPTPTNPFTEPNTQENTTPNQEGEENIFDDDLSAGKNSLGQNPEQILYNEPNQVEDAGQILSDGNDE